MRGPKAQVLDLRQWSREEALAEAIRLLRVADKARAMLGTTPQSHMPGPVQDLLLERYAIETCIREMELLD